MKLSNKNKKSLRTSLESIKSRQLFEETYQFKMDTMPSIPPLCIKREPEYELNLKEGVCSKKIKLDKVNNVYSFQANQDLYDDFIKPYDNTKFNVNFISTPFNEEVKALKLSGIEKIFAKKKGKLRDTKTQINYLDRLESCLKNFETNINGLVGRKDLKFNDKSLTVIKDKISLHETKALHFNKALAKTKFDTVYMATEVTNFG